MRILSLHGGHDSAAALFDGYDLVAAIQLERLSRVKNDGAWPEAAIDEVLRIGNLQRSDIDQIILSRNFFRTDWLRFDPARTLRYRIRNIFGDKHHKSIFGEMQRRGIDDAMQIWRGERFLSDQGFRPDTPVAFSNHHLAHALSALFFAPPWEQALAYTSDGIGDGVHYSARILKNGSLDCLFGDQVMDVGAASLGLAYGYCTQQCGFRINRHEGKLTGLAAYGEPDLAPDLAKLFHVENDGRISSPCTTGKELNAAVSAICKGADKETIAASAQKVLEDTLCVAIGLLLEQHGVSNLALAGGVFANVRLNALLADLPGVDEIFIAPPMGDEGIVVGGALQFLLERDGVDHWLEQRYRLEDVYLGSSDHGADNVFNSHGSVHADAGSSASKAAQLIAEGLVGAIYTGRTEFGPRALGARSIIASPADNDVNETINARLDRSEFMPFAPCVLEEDAEEVFKIDKRTEYACRFMTITTGVRETWRELIPAVVHVDGSARPQIINRAKNPLYADILDAFKKRTGLPVMVNTSFNAHEEPIINTPEEALKALINGRVDFLVTENAVYRNSMQDAG